MRVIFADIDGTLIPLSPTGKHGDGPLAPTKEAIDNLNLLVQATGAKVVVSSSWRIGRSVNDLVKLFKSWGANFTIFDKIPTNDDEDRGGDILLWNSRHNDSSFVVLDDEDTDLEKISHNVVLVNPQRALQLHDVELAVRILNERREHD